MINHKKLLSYSLSTILACTLLSGVGFAAHKKKKAAADATAATTATTTQTAATTSKSKRAAKKLAAESKPAETAPAAAPAAKSEPAKTTMMTHKTPAATTSTASASDIANAKSKGMVWVNTESKVYHTDGKYYGNTKHGQFMSAADAQKAGYKAAKR